MLSQANAYLLAYVHVCGEEVAGEGSRQPVSAHINPGLHRQDAERLDGHSQHYPGSEAGSNHPSDASSTMSAYEQDFADNHPEEYAAKTAEERADVKSKGRKIKKKARQKASKDKKKQCGLAEAAAKGAAKHPASGNSDAAQLVQHPTQIPGRALSLHPKGANTAVSRLASPFDAQASSSHRFSNLTPAPPAEPASSSAQLRAFGAILSGEQPCLTLLFWLINAFVHGCA